MKQYKKIFSYKIITKIFFNTSFFRQQKNIARMQKFSCLHYLIFFTQEIYFIFLKIFFPRKQVALFFSFDHQTEIS